eukprot:3440029-Prymnesium_polylepis.1
MLHTIHVRNRLRPLRARARSAARLSRRVHLRRRRRRICRALARTTSYTRAAAPRARGVSSGARAAVAALVRTTAVACRPFRTARVMSGCIVRV